MPRENGKRSIERAWFRPRIQSSAGISFVGLLVVMLTGAVFSKDFLTVTNLMNVLVQGSAVAILAAGMTLIFISGGIDLSVGTIMTLSSCSFGMMVLTLRLGIFPCLILASGIGSAAGFINGLIVAKGKIQPFIVTLGMMGTCQGLAMTISAGYSMFGFPDFLVFFGSGKSFGIPIPVLLMLGVYLFMFLLIRYTRVGHYAYAIGGNEQGARLAGINTDHYKILFYTANGLLASVAGIIPNARIYSAFPGYGAGLELDAIAAALIGGASLMGGRGSLPGTFIGALIISTLKNGLNLFEVSPFVQKMGLGAIIIGAALLDRFNAAGPGPGRLQGSDNQTIG